MFYNFLFPSSKNWKRCWIKFTGQFIELSDNESSEPFAAIHMGIYKLRPSGNYPYPNVLEFYDDTNVAGSSIFTYSYIIFDTFHFLENVSTAYSQWNNIILHNAQPKSSTGYVKKMIAFIKTKLQYTVYPDKITFTKGAASLKTINFLSSFPIAPTFDLEKNSILFGSDKDEYRVGSIRELEELLDAIYYNIKLLIQK